MTTPEPEKQATPSSSAEEYKYKTDTATSSSPAEPLILVTPQERGAIVQEIRRDMLRSMLLAPGGDLTHKELQAFRELCKDYEAPSGLQLEALEARIQTLENTAIVAAGKYHDGGPIMLGP